MRAAKNHGAKKVLVRSDSQLMVNQMKGKYKVKDAKLKLLKAELDHLVSGFEDVHFDYVPRELNARADDLAKGGAEKAQARGVRPAQEPLLE